MDDRNPTQTTNQLKIKAKLKAKNSTESVSGH